jgi:hypothetical protein
MFITSRESAIEFIPFHRIKALACRRLRRQKQTLGGNPSFQFGFERISVCRAYLNPGKPGVKPNLRVSPGFIPVFWKITLV